MDSKFTTTNNEVKSKALIIVILVDKEMGAKHLCVHTDSLFIDSNVNGSYQDKDPMI